MDPKPSRVVTNDEGTPPTKPCNTLIKWSRDKSKALYLYFHKAYGQQPCNLVTQNEGTPSTRQVTYRPRSHVIN